LNPNSTLNDRSTKREVLNHFVCILLSQIDYLINCFADFYKAKRPHQGTDKRIIRKAYGWIQTLSAITSLIRTLNSKVRHGPKVFRNSGAFYVIIIATLLDTQNEKLYSHEPGLNPGKFLIAYSWSHEPKSSENPDSCRSSLQP